METTSPAIRRRTPVLEHRASLLVAMLSSTLGALLLQVGAAISLAVHADDRTGSSETAAFLVTLATWVFIVITVVVGAIVTTNAFAAIVAGRLRSIALMRLIGATASQQRRAIAREGLLVGTIGALTGALVGTLLGIGLMAAAVVAGVAPDLPYPPVTAEIVAPTLVVVATTWAASWFGAARVTEVTPLQALAASEEHPPTVARGRTILNRVAVALLAVGGAVIVLGIVMGLEVGFTSVFIVVAGGILTFVGIILIAERIMPPVLRLVGQVLGRSAPARLAAGNAMRYPERSARTIIGVVIPVTLITMFAVALATFDDIMLAAQRNQPEVYAGIDSILLTTLAVVTVLIGFSALIAAVGLANTLALTVMQRTREIGLLRALGFTARQVRSMIHAESAQLTIAALVVGFALGVLYGWAGAQSLLGTVNGSPGLVLPSVPWPLPLAVAVLIALLTLIASVAPTRHALRQSPVAALAAD